MAKAQIKGRTAPTIAKLHSVHLLSGLSVGYTHGDGTNSMSNDTI